MSLIDRIPLMMVVVLCATLGLAPFVPEPHVWEKLKMLASGELRAIVDWLDFAMHGVPWLLLIAKLARMALVSSKT